MTTAPNPLTRWAGRKPVCTKCGTAVSRPVQTNHGRLRGECQTCGKRMDAEWVKR